MFVLTIFRFVDM